MDKKIIKIVYYNLVRVIIDFFDLIKVIINIIMWYYGLLKLITPN